MLEFIRKLGITILAGFCCIAVAEQNDSFLLNTTGNYGVGYQDVFLINTDICPDAFYKKDANENDFSQHNEEYCHEIALRIYYPSISDNKLHDQYYQPYINDTNNWLIKTYKLDQKEINVLQSSKNIKIYTQKDAKPINNKKFPIIIFMPGSGTQAQAYTNIISNLVSNGYIVVGVNSLFINGAIELKNGHVVLPPTEYLDADGRKENINDLKFVLNNMHSIKFKHDLEKNIDWHKLELIGHSRGAMSIINLLKNEKDIWNIKALILLDPADKLGPVNYPLPNLNIPTLNIWSTQLKLDWDGRSTPARDCLTVTLKPQSAADDYSGHNNFMDSSTLQYHPAYQIPSLQKLPKFNYFALGTGDGYELAQSINDYILIFTNNYLAPNSKKSEFKCKNFNHSYLCEANN